MRSELALSTFSVPAIFLPMAKQSPLTELHRANGAQWNEEDGWMLPAHFGDPLKEYQSARAHVGLLDLAHRSILRFTGSDRVSYLQGMVSNDVKALTQGDGSYATILDVHGKIQADVRIFCTEDFFLMDCWEPLKERVVAHLSRYLIADDVEITDLAEQYAILSLQGPKARPILETFLSPDSIPSKELSHSTISMVESNVRLVRSNHTGEEGFDLIVPLKDFEAVALRIQEAGKKFSLQWVGTQALELLRVEAGIPSYGADFEEDTLPLEANLLNAVSFTKGCYLGQEIVERARSRGQVNWKLVGLVLDTPTPAAEGEKLLAAGKEMGEITSSCVSPTLGQTVALGYLRREVAEPGSTVNLFSNQASAQVVNLPFYTPPSQ